MSVGIITSTAPITAPGLAVRDYDETRVPLDSRDVLYARSGYVEGEAISDLPPVGVRVRVVTEWDIYPHAAIPAGSEGVVTESEPNLVAVRLDDEHPGLAEWGNEAHIYPTDTDQRVSGYLWWEQPEPVHFFTDRTSVVELRRDEYGARVLEDGERYALAWTDYVANDWTEHYDDLAGALARLAALEHASTREAFFTDDAHVFASKADLFLRTVAEV